RSRMSTRARGDIAALLTRTSIRPYASNVSATSLSRAFASPRSAWTARARRPSDVTSATALSAAFESARKWTTMSKPCLASSTAVAGRIPLEEPVTSATGAGFSEVMGTVYGALGTAKEGGHAPQSTQRKEEGRRRTSRDDLRGGVE